MINLFQLSSGDRSMQYLYQIFGDVGGVLYGVDVSGNKDSGLTINPLGALFETFNSTVLAVAALIVIYVTVVGVMKTAHEGEMMGKQWSSLWLPIRMVMGIASLVPISGGYCALQIVMMWVIVQGIGAADVLWNTALNYVDKMGSLNASPSVPTVGTNSSIQQLYKGIICDATFRKGYANPRGVNAMFSPGGEYYCASHSTDSWCKSSLTFKPEGDSFTLTPGQRQMFMGPGGACGVMTYCSQDDLCKNDSNTLSCKVCKKQVEVLGQITTLFSGYAAALVDADYQYRLFYESPTPEPPPSFAKDYCQEHGMAACDKANLNSLPSYTSDSFQSADARTVSELYIPNVMMKITGPGDYVATNSEFYTSSIDGIVNEHMKLISKEAAEGKKLTGNLAFAQDAGWIMAGSFYYLIGKQNKTNQDSTIPSFSVSNSTELSTKYRAYRTNESAAGSLVTQAGKQASGAQGGAGASNISQSETKDVAVAMTDSVNSAGNAFASNLNSVANGVNPLVQLQATGYAMLFIAGLLWLLFLILSIGFGLLSGVSVYVAGNTITNPLSVGALIIYIVIAPTFFGLLLLLITVGAMLGVYVPLIPYVIFTMGSIGWFLSVLEAMVAGPLVALGILSPSGQHDLLGKAEPALMLLFNIFLRPSLMIFGLIASFALAIAVLTLINSGFGLVLTSMVYVGDPQLAVDAAGNVYNPSGAAAMAFNPLQLVIFLCAYVMLIVTALNKCFAAIHIIPEKVMRWIGSQGEQYGEHEGVSAVKGATEAGAGGMKSAVKEQEGKAEKARDVEKAEKDRQAGMTIKEKKP